MQVRGLHLHAENPKGLWIEDALSPQVRREPPGVRIREDATAVTVTGAQKPVPAQRSNVAGTWDGKTMTGPKDSVVATFELRAAADTTGWTLKFTGRDPHAARVVAMGGDSVVPTSGRIPASCGRV
jgi:hypothetical protein